MNVKYEKLTRLGIPIYTDENNEDYVRLVDVKLAVDRDVYERILTKLKRGGNGTTVLASWLERQSLGT